MLHIYPLTIQILETSSSQMLSILNYLSHSAYTNPAFRLTFKRKSIKNKYERAKNFARVSKITQRKEE